jgi:O-glycosyl hydrolase
MQPKTRPQPICLLSIALAFLGVAPIEAQTALRIDPADRRQTFEGWGTSLAWWAYSLGGWKESSLGTLADQVADTNTGLGMTIFRYNIGGGDQPGHAHMRVDAGVPGYKPTEAGPFAWRADSLQLRTLKALLARVKLPVLEAFSNSPPWWMTKSGCASGSVDGSNNLKDDYYDDFADYLTEVVGHLQDSLGLEFRTLEPFNEPNSNWWKAQGRQEGCMFSRATQPKLILEVAKSLKAKGLTGTGIAAADANSIAEMAGNLQAYDSASLAALVQVNTHSYYGSDADRRNLKALAARAGKRLWQSEAGPLNWPGGNQFAVGMWSASLIAKDLREMGAEAWIDWQVAGGGLCHRLQRLGPDQQAEQEGIRLRPILPLHPPGIDHPGRRGFEYGGGLPARVRNLDLGGHQSPRGDGRLRLRPFAFRGPSGLGSRLSHLGHGRCGSGRRHSPRLGGAQRPVAGELDHDLRDGRDRGGYPSAEPDGKNGKKHWRENRPDGYSRFRTAESVPIRGCGGPSGAAGMAA